MAILEKGLPFFVKSG